MSALHLEFHDSYTELLPWKVIVVDRGIDDDQKMIGPNIENPEKARASEEIGAEK